LKIAGSLNKILIFQILNNQKTNPKKINVNDIGKPIKIANSITPTSMKPKIAGSIKCEIIQPLAIYLW
tara:strand:+ start:1079 stop:1282 length:204 start_codon:yes stop_codon:yes gene_type:complete